MISLKFTTLIDKHNYDCIFGYLSLGGFIIMRLISMIVILVLFY